MSRSTAKPTSAGSAILKLASATGIGRLKCWIRCVAKLVAVRSVGDRTAAEIDSPSDRRDDNQKLFELVRNSILYGVRAHEYAD